MKSFWISVHRAARNVFFQATVGFLIFFSGLWEFIYFTPEEGEFYTLQGFHATMLLGVFYFLVALEHLLYGFKLVGLAAVEYSNGKKNLIQKKLCCILENPFFELFLALLILTAGIIEVWEDMAGAGGTVDDGCWQYGLIILGVFGMVRSIAGLIKALILVKIAEEKKGWHIQLVDSVNNFIRKPLVEIAVAVTLVTLGVFEEVWFEAIEQDGVFIEAHHGMIIFGLQSIAQHLPSLFIGVQLMDDAGNHKQN